MIPRYIAALADPNLPAGQKQLASELMKRALDNAKLPEKIQVLQALKDSDPSFKGSLLDLEVKLRNAGKTDVNLLPGERSYDVQVGKDLADRFLELNKAGVNAQRTQSTLDVMDRAMRDPNFYSGPLSGLALAAKRAYAKIDPEAADSATATELFQKMSNKLVTDVAGGGGGGLGSGISNADRDYIGATVPNLQNNPPGNRLIMQVMRAAAKRDVETAQMARDYARAHGGRLDYEFYTELKKYADENSILKGIEFPKEAPPPAGSGEHKNIQFKLNPS
jgi:hypothetical protein